MRSPERTVSLSKKNAHILRSKIRSDQVKFAVMVEVCGNDDLRFHPHRIELGLLEL